MKSTSHDELQGLHNENVRLRHELAIAKAVNAAMRPLQGGARPEHRPESKTALRVKGPRLEAAPPLEPDESLVTRRRTDEDYRNLYAEFLRTPRGTLKSWCEQKGLNYPSTVQGFSRNGLGVRGQKRGVLSHER